LFDRTGKQLFGIVLFSILFILFILWFDRVFALHLVARSNLDMLFLLVVILVIS